MVWVARSAPSKEGTTIGVTGIIAAISRQDKREPQTIGEFFNKTADTVDTADTAVNFFPLSAGFSGGAFSLAGR
jgi:hypothetical protein